jgi:hypothetical protein
MKTSLGLPDREMHMNNKCSLILRLWRNENSSDRIWRASVEIPEASKRFGFSSLEQLFAFLIDFTDANCDNQFVENKKKENKYR